MMRVIILFLFLGCFHIAYGNTLDSFFVSPEDFGCVSGDKSFAAQNSECLQKMFDYAKDHRKQIISSGDRTFFINKEIRVTGFVIADFGGASLVAVDSIAMISLDMQGSQWKGVLKNFRLNLNSVAKYGIFGKHPEKFRVTDGEIVGIGSSATGIFVEAGFELFVDNMHFRGSKPEASAIVLQTSDCHVSSVVIIDCQNGIVMIGSNFFSQIHGWIQNPEFLPNSKLFVAKIGSDNYISQSYSDTYENAFYIEGAARLHISEMKIYHNLNKWNAIDSSKVQSFAFFYKKPELVQKSKIFFLNSHIGTLKYGGRNKMRLSNFKMALKKENHVYFEK